MPVWYTRFRALENAKDAKERADRLMAAAQRTETYSPASIASMLCDATTLFGDVVTHMQKAAANSPQAEAADAAEAVKVAEAEAAMAAAVAAAMAAAVAAAAMLMPLLLRLRGDYNAVVAMPMPLLQ